jgi:dipeptidyl aminopeptidase/acylaminoacyl peptidase
LFLVAVSGGQPRQLTSDARQISGHDWAQDGNSIVIASDRGGDFRLWRLDPANRSEAPVPLGVYGEFPIQLSVARTAPRLVYSVLQHDRNIWRLDLEGLRWTRIIASTAQDASPQYSPSGDRICFRSDRSGEDQLWVSRADGSNPMQITYGKLAPSVARWSPDGRSIVFNSARNIDLHVATLGAGGAWSVRPLGVAGVHPVYSPDGLSIYAGDRNGTSLLRLPVGGGAPVELARTRAISLDIAQDGKFVYFVREPNENKLWRASTATGELSLVLNGLLPRCTSCWALTPAGVYYLGNSPQSFDAQMLYFHDFATGRDRPVIEYPEPLWPIGSGPFSLSPDRRSLLVVRVEPSNSDIMRVEPFR